MASNYNTPGVPDPEVSAMQQRAKTGALPNDSSLSQPKVWGPWVPTDEYVRRQADKNGINLPNPN